MTGIFPALCPEGRSKINADTKKKLNQYIDQDRIVAAEIDRRQFR